MANRLLNPLSYWLTWEIERPYPSRSRISSKFSFMNAEFYLKLYHFKDSYRNLYRLILDKMKDVRPVQRYTVTAFLQHDGNGVWYPQRTIISNDGNTLLLEVTEHSLSSTFSNFDKEADMSFVCIFEALPDRPLKEKIKVEKSVQAYFDPALTLKTFLHTEGLDTACFSTDEDLTFSLGNLSQDLKSLLEKDHFPDVTLKNGDWSMKAHRAILSARSDVFAAMFRHEMTESEIGVVNITDVEVSVLEIFVKYLYSGILPGCLQLATVQHLYEASDKYAVNGLKKICSNFMIRNVNEDNFTSFLTLADRHSDHDFKEAIELFILSDETLVKKDAWLKLTTENPALAVGVYRRIFKT